MGRTKKFPPLPPKEGDQVVALIPMPKVTPELIEDRKRELALLARTELDQRFDSIIDKIFSLPDTFEGPKGLSLEPLKLKFDAVKWLGDRGYGKAPQIVKLGSDEGSPAAILEEIAKKRTDAVLAQLEAERARAEAITTEVVETTS